MTEDLLAEIDAAEARLLARVDAGFWRQVAWAVERGATPRGELLIADSWAWKRFEVQREHDWLRAAVSAGGA